MMKTKKFLLLLTIFSSFILISSGCSGSKDKDASKESESSEEVAKKDAKEATGEVADNVYVAMDDTVTMDNEVFSSSDFDLQLTGMDVTEVDGGQANLTIYFSFTNKTDAFKTGASAFEQYMTVYQEVDGGSDEKLSYSTDSISEKIDQLNAVAEESQPIDEKVKMSLTFKTVSTDDVRLDMFDGNGDFIVSKRYLIASE